jgi:Zn-dependent M32 family carboxypeptidase
VHRGWIRVDADEMNSPHIMQRYEIEKQLLAGKLRCAICRKWNAGMEQRLACA